ncbi:hypothetical protein [Ruminococcus albus]|uniref:Uncharacterized protein n=1 Tax=Ruminococcus albus TaxID=1264 RepID=A0A1I1RUH3_RUMAL|nr:hypothetical protein [Ruminococcus albus]SFD37901.1 hypothetical protein SAMN02910406_03775 [Ruminococcus albus]
MRKGQLKLIDKAQRCGIAEDRIDLLKQEDLTLKELEKVFWILCSCSDMPMELPVTKQIKGLQKRTPQCRM